MIEAAAPLVLTDGGIETRIIYEFHRDLANFNASLLLAEAAGRDILERMYASYAAVAARHGLPIQLGTPTWRASARWLPAGTGLHEVNAAAVALVRDAATRAGAKVVVAGVIGPAEDGYDPTGAPSEEEAFQYHLDQVQALAAAGVDMLYAPTFPAFDELHGAARAMARSDVPYVLAPMLKPDGRMLDGTPLHAAIRRIDTSVSPEPMHYGIGCLYPTHAREALTAARDADADAVRRVRSLKANASPLPPEELDKLDRISAAPPEQFALDLWACAREFGLTVLGGCCGTDQRDIEAIATLA